MMLVKKYELGEFKVYLMATSRESFYIVLINGINSQIIQMKDHGFEESSEVFDYLIQTGGNNLLENIKVEME